MSVCPPRRPYALRVGHPLRIVAVTTALGATAVPPCLVATLVVLAMTGYFGGPAAPYRGIGACVVGTVFEIGVLTVIARAESARLAAAWLCRRPQ